MDWKTLAALGIKGQVESAQGSGTIKHDISNGINLAFAVAGIIAAIVIIVGGISYATSQGDPSKISKGKKLIITGIVGLLIVLLAFAIVSFVLTSMGA